VSQQNPTPGSEIILYQTEDGRTRLEVKLESNTVWLSQAQIAELFQTTPQNITLHLKSIFAEGELVETATCKDYLQVRLEGKRSVQRQIRHYNLEVIISPCDPFPRRRSQHLLHPLSFRPDARLQTQAAHCPRFIQLALPGRRFDGAVMHTAVVRVSAEAGWPGRGLGEVGSGGLMAGRFGHFIWDHILRPGRRRWWVALPPPHICAGYRR